MNSFRPRAATNRDPSARSRPRRERRPGRLVRLGVRAVCLTAAVGAIGAAVAGCQQTPTPQTPAAVKQTGDLISPPDPDAVVMPKQTGEAVPPEKNFVAVLDPCGERMEDGIASMLLAYYAAHHKLPATLEELRPYAAAAGVTEVNFTCPVSGKPYVYVPTGLVSTAPGGTPGKRLIVFDPTPAHNRNTARRGIVEQIGPRGDLQLFTVPLAEQVFKTYTPAAIQPLSPPVAGPAAPRGVLPSGPEPAAPATEVPPAGRGAGRQ